MIIAAKNCVLAIGFALTFSSNGATFMSRLVEMPLRDIGRQTAPTTQTAQENSEKLAQIESTWKRLKYCLSNYAGGDTIDDYKTMKVLKRDTYSLLIRESSPREQSVVFRKSAKDWYTLKNRDAAGDDYCDGELIHDVQLTWTNIDVIEVIPSDPLSKNPGPNRLNIKLKEKSLMMVEFKDNLKDEEDFREMYKQLTTASHKKSVAQVSLLFSSAERLQATSKALVAWLKSLGLNPSLNEIDPAMTSH
jgi:hypothetical protein